MEHSNPIHYSVVVPVYNTTTSLAALVQRIQQVFFHIGDAYEILLVDDGSVNQGTWPMIEKLVRDNEQVQGILLAGNHGQHAASLCGMAHARGEFLFTMDDDLQHAPEDIPVLIACKDHDVVMGQFIDKKHSPARKLASKVKGVFDQLLSGKPQGLQITSFCLFKRGIAEQILLISPASKPLMSTLIFQVTRDVLGVQVSHSSRQEGESGYSFLSLLKLFSRLFVSRPNLHKQESGARTKPYTIKLQISKPYK